MEGPMAIFDFDGKLMSPVKWIALPFWEIALIKTDIEKE